MSNTIYVHGLENTKVTVERNTKGNDIIVLKLDQSVEEHETLHLVLFFSNVRSIEKFIKELRRGYNSIE